MESNPFEISLSGPHVLIIPDHIAEAFLEAGHKRVEVKATFEDKTVAFHGAIQKRNGQYLMIFGKKLQKALGVYPNDYFELQFFKDTSKYGVEMPEELAAVLMSDHEAAQIFESFTDGKKRGIIYMVLGYKNSQTRIDKSLRICENLKRGIRKNPDLLKSF
ncbi:YdeI/OmpD-associated family protein [Muriicola sp. Z0-33]|uniref:YdeI/OmpD-associated family protein n=1 Tax=Muriicola sp. Z0-33 TaxID=2816957 RepID=UPI00223786D7|nr:YdeI/OmpD-associated family protein [Muriicola sp. Z0-33]MCW5517021.1 YdeI/OmpD-associated family protein [Muriicola sp. Z0-33]